ncbi:hypothetical protein [Streptomyces sp. NPDC056169]|uniref:hypothetical protein n=1 Tax=Streptomyces sp. NPDC056169 TaxID=3345734 RepID=UPI0035E2FF76
MTVDLPIPIVVTRHQCPHCRATRSKKTAAIAHIGRCWKNPAVRSCKTCDNYDPGGVDCGCDWRCSQPQPPSCGAKVPLPDGPTVVTDCPKWEPREDWPC